MIQRYNITASWQRRQFAELTPWFVGPPDWSSGFTLLVRTATIGNEEGIAEATEQARKIAEGIKESIELASLFTPQSLLSALRKANTDCYPNLQCSAAAAVFHAEEAWMATIGDVAVVAHRGSTLTLVARPATTDLGTGQFSFLTAALGTRNYDDASVALFRLDPSIGRFFVLAGSWAEPGELLERVSRARVMTAEALDVAGLIIVDASVPGSVRQK